MDPVLQLFLQLGIAGAMLWVFYKLGGKALDQQRVTDSERTKVIGDGFSAITIKIDTHASADLNGHREIVDRVSRFEGKLDANLDASSRVERSNTPIEGVPFAHPQQHTVTRTTPPHGTPTPGGYHKRRGETDGGR